MADRSVVVKLRAEVDSYIAGLNQAKTATTSFGKEVANKGKGASADIERIGTVSIVAGAAITAAFGKAIFTAANFEKELSGVKAVSGASADEMNRLKDAALAAGASQKLAGVTASDAARAEQELVKAGISVNEVLGGALMGSLTLASAGQLDFADAATIAAQAMNIFDLSGRDVGHVADVLAAAANKSAGDVGQFGDALRQGGLVAAQTGLTLEESVGALAAFADNALIGSDAGTSLKTMLQRLTPQSKEAAALMEELGFSAYDTYGNFIGLEGLAGELTSSLSDMTVEQRNSALATLFGSDAVRGANVLYEEGAAGIHDYVTAVNDEGAAAEMAAIQNDNLKGDIEALGGALETALITNGSKATDALRSITSGATDLVGGFSSMPDALQTVTLGLGAVVGATTLIGGGFVNLAPKIKQSTEALNKMDSSLANFAGANMGKLTAGLAGIGAALTAGVWIYGQATTASRAYEEQVTNLATALDPVTEGQADLNDELEAFLKAQSEGLSTDALKALNAFRVGMDDIQGSIRRGGDALDPLREKVKELGVDLDGVDLGDLDDAGMETQLVRLADALGVDASALKDLIDQTEDWDNVSQDSARKTVEAAVSHDTFKQSAVDAAVEVSTLKDGTTNWVGVLDILKPKVVDTGDAAETTTGQVEGMTTAEDDAAEAAEGLKTAIENLLVPLDSRAAIDQFSSGINDMAKHFADADAEVSDAQEDMRDRQQDLNDLLATPVEDRGDDFDRRVQSAKDAIVDARTRIDEAVAASSRTLEGNSEAALDNRDMLDQLARDGTDAIEAAAADQSLSLGEVMWLRGALIGQMEAEATRLGLNKEQVGFYTEALENIPLGDIRTNVGVTGVDEAIAKIETLEARLRNLAATDQVYSVDFQQAEQQYARQQRANNQAVGGLVPQHLAVGGFPGGPRGSDTIPTWLTPGEYVINANAASRLGVSMLDDLNAGRFGSMGSANGYSSMDYSRHVSMPVDIRAYGNVPRRTFGGVVHDLRVLQTQMSVR